MSVQDLINRANSGLMVEEESKLPVFVVGNINLTAREARELVATNPKHPAAKDLQKAVATLSDDYTVNIDKATLFSITENKKLVEKRVMRDGEAVRIRVLSDEPMDAQSSESTTTTTPSKLSRRELDESTSESPSVAEGSSAVGREGSGPVLEDSPQAIREATQKKEERAGLHSAEGTEVLQVAEELPPEEAENRRLGAQNLESRPASLTGKEVTGQGVEPKGRRPVR